MDAKEAMEILKKQSYEAGKKEMIEKFKPVVEALEKISRAKHCRGCSDSDTHYMGYCNCAEKIANEVIKSYRKDVLGE